MKKIVLLMLIVLSSFGLFACNNEPIDISIDDAFDLMNQSIQNYLDAESVDMIYSGLYESDINSLRDSLRVKIKKIGSDEMLGKVEIDVSVNGAEYSIENVYQSGQLYTINSDDTQTKKTQEPYAQADYLKLYKSFLKARIERVDTRSLQIMTDAKSIAMSFELDPQAIENTFYVLPSMDTAKIAKVTITFDENARLLSMSVEYEAEIQDVYGDFTYAVTFVKIDQYILISQLSNSQKNTYEVVPDDEA